jgi:hypothetical protein
LISGGAGATEEDVVTVRFVLLNMEEAGLAEALAVLFRLLVGFRAPVILVILAIVLPREAPSLTKRT